MKGCVRKETGEILRSTFAAHLLVKSIKIKGQIELAILNDYYKSWSAKVALFQRLPSAYILTILSANLTTQRSQSRF